MSSFGEERVLRISALELYDSVRVHARIHIEYDFEWNTCRLSAEVDYVLYAACAGDWTSADVGCETNEHVAGEEWLKARATAHEWEERKKVLAAKIELDPPLRARLCVHELPGSIAERRYVGVVHVSDFIHNKGNVRSGVECVRHGRSPIIQRGTW